MAKAKTCGQLKNRYEQQAIKALSTEKDNAFMFSPAVGPTNRQLMTMNLADK